MRRRYLVTYDISERRRPHDVARSDPVDMSRPDITLGVNQRRVLTDHSAGGVQPHNRNLDDSISAPRK